MHSLLVSLFLISKIFNVFHICFLGMCCSEFEFGRRFSLFLPFPEALLISVNTLTPYSHLYTHFHTLIFRISLVFLTLSSLSLSLFKTHIPKQYEALADFFYFISGVTFFSVSTTRKFKFWEMAPPNDNDNVWLQFWE